MRPSIVSLLASSLFFLSCVAHAGACSQYNNVVGFVGLDNPNGSVYVSVAEHNNACNCSNIRFYDSNTDTDKALSILLAARFSDQRVRIDIADENDCDSGYRVYIQ